ncbi:hypothetical protein [Actinorugispora endophytica]|uniref:Uncharacterized protein n=1 Tax=Actinorugispora endophytica TaxID=1605990 RepID=A0A4R6V4N2_9ACTN|nr:hypothetical protein [Actinorugispora endophytica]TDQ55291.1 hypothetical protein EV190_101616 [Actinorugispora endophytica]
MTDHDDTGAPRTASHGEVLVRMVEHGPARRRWSSRNRRRALVLAQALVCSAAAVGMYLVPRLPAVVIMPVFLVLMAAGVLLGTQLNIAARWVAGLPTLDERQRADQERARRMGHHVTAGLLFALFLAATVLWTARAAPVEAGVVAASAWLAVMTHTSFPAAYLAWTLPDEVPDDEAQ